MAGRGNAIFAGLLGLVVMAASLGINHAEAQIKPQAQPSLRLLDFAELEGWDQDDHLDALKNFITTCDLLKGEEWKPICAFAPQAAKDSDTARAFFEAFFRPVQVGDGPALFTGYYEPVLNGSLVRTPRFAYPLYRRPPDLVDGQPYHSRSMIDAGSLAGRGLELVWIDDPVEVFFLQIQGSGRVMLPNGRMMRVGYAGKNNHPYRSVGQELIRRGTHSPADMSAQSIKSWVRGNPVSGQGLLSSNPSYVFFRRIDTLSAAQGPIGAMGRSIATLRSLAVDPAHTPLGAPVWVEKEGAAPMRRLMVAQDTGGAIKGAQRGDIFFGTGKDAGRQAGNIKDKGRLVQLLPIERAYALLAKE